MRERKLSREEAVEEYIIYQLRLYDYLHMFQIALAIKDEEVHVLMLTSIRYGPRGIEAGY